MDRWGLRSWVQRKRCRKGAEENKWPPTNTDEKHNDSFTVLSGSIADSGRLLVAIRPPGEGKVRAVTAFPANAIRLPEEAG
jgi:hypothetical protein